MKSKMVGFTDKDLPILNEVIQDFETRLSRVDNTVPTSAGGGEAITHKLPIVINGTTYNIMLTTS